MNDRVTRDGDRRYERGWWGGSESGRERVPRDALGSERERGVRREREGGSKSSGLASVGWYPAREEGGRGEGGEDK